MLLKINPTTGNLDLVQDPAALGTPVNIGTDDTTNGIINIYGDNANTGGALRVYLGASYDDTIEYYEITSSEDDLIIGPDTNPDIIKVTAEGALEFDLTTATPVTMTFTGAQQYPDFRILCDDDGTNRHPYFTIESKSTSRYPAVRWYNGTNWFSMGLINDALRWSTGSHPATNSIVQLESDATMSLGIVDNTRGRIVCRGAGTSQNPGGMIELHGPKDYDSGVYPNLYAVYNWKGTLRFGTASTGNAAILFYNPNTDILRLMDESGIVELGDDITVRGQLYLRGHATGTDDGGELRLYTSADHDTNIDHFIVKAYQDDLRIGTDDVAEIITLSAESSVIINEGGNDIDFRVESDTNTNMLFVDAGNNRVGIGTGTPNSILEIATSTESLEIVDAGSAGATEQDWIQVEVGGNVGYIRVFAAA